jgi:serine/threonine-protein kinase
VLDLLHKHRYGQFDPPRKLVPELPHEIDAIVCELLEKDPADRPSDGLVLQRRLDAINRRLQRREEPTRVLGPNDSDHDDTTEFEGPHVRGPGPATLMSRLVRAELREQDRDGPLVQLLRRPWVLVTLLLLAVAGIAWAFWPLSAETLYRRGAALMQSDNPEDWHTAWRKYLGPLEEKHPHHPYQEEVARFRGQLDEYEAERQARRAAAAQRPMSEAQWFYQQGLRLRQQGNEAAARRTWENLVHAFQDVPAEKTWVARAEEQLKQPAVPPGKERWMTVQAALERARALQQAGQPAEAEAIRQGLEELYRDDPSATDIRVRIRDERAKE